MLNCHLGANVISGILLVILRLLKFYLIFSHYNAQTFC